MTRKASEIYRYKHIYQNTEGMVCYDRQYKCIVVFEKDSKGRMIESFEVPTADEGIEYLKGLIVEKNE